MHNNIVKINEKISDKKRLGDFHSATCSSVIRTEEYKTKNSTFVTSHIFSKQSIKTIEYVDNSWMVWTFQNSKAEKLKIKVENMGPKAERYIGLKVTERIKWKNEVIFNKLIKLIDTKN